MLVPFLIGKYQESRICAIKGQADLIYRQGTFYLAVTLDVPEPTVETPVQLLSMVDNLINLCKPPSRSFFIMVQSRQATFSCKKAPSIDFCSHFPPPPHGMILRPHLAVVALKRKLAARGKRAPRAPSIVGWFFRLPWLEFAADSVAPPVCPLALEAA